ncbi:MAG: hypothetical protein AAF437_05480 [Pseudomonadota bacterium]
MGNGNKVEFLVAICALITSAMAVFMAWDQGSVMRAQQHGAVFPVLQVDGFAENDGASTALGINVRNSGVGPALIESVDFYVNDQRTERFDEYIDTLPRGYDLSYAAISGRALAPAETVTAISIRWPNNAFDRSTIAQVQDDSDTWSLEICYCSVFNRCWKTSQIGQSRATPVNKCTRKEGDIFESLGEPRFAPSAPAQSQ